MSSSPMYNDSIRYSRLVRQSFLRARNIYPDHLTPASISASTSVSGGSSSRVHFRQSPQFRTVRTRTDIPQHLHQQPSAPPRKQQRLQRLQQHNNTENKTLTQRRPRSRPRSWFDILPTEICERIVAFIQTSSASSSVLLQVGESCNALRHAVITCMNHTLILDECTLPDISRWASLFIGSTNQSSSHHYHHVNLHTLHVHHRLRCFNAQNLLPSLHELLSLKTLSHVTVPAIPSLLRILAAQRQRTGRSALESLSVYLRNRDDAANLLSYQWYDVKSLELQCVQHDNAHADPFCFASHCATELLAAHFAQLQSTILPEQQPEEEDQDRNLLRKRFPDVVELHLRCHHKLPCDIWPVIDALPRLHSVSLCAPVVLRDDYETTFRRLRRVELEGVRDAVQHAIKLGYPISKVSSHDVLYSAKDLHDLFRSCPHLSHLSLSVDPELASSSTSEEQQQPEISITKVLSTFMPRNLRTLNLRFGYSDMDLAVARMQRSPTSTASSVTARLQPHVHGIDMLFVNALSKLPMLRVLHLEFVRISPNVIASLIQQLPQLETLAISIEGQLLPADVQLIALCNVLIRHQEQVDSISLKRIHFIEVSDGTEQLYRVHLTNEQKHVLINKLDLLRSRVRLVDLSSIEKAMSRMCGVQTSADW